MKSTMKCPFVPDFPSNRKEIIARSQLTVHWPILALVAVEDRMRRHVNLVIGWECEEAHGCSKIAFRAQLELINPSQANSQLVEGIPTNAEGDIIIFGCSTRQLPLAGWRWRRRLRARYNTRPQSAQSVPSSQSLLAEFGPPSLQTPLLRYVSELHMFEHSITHGARGGWGGDGGRGGKEGGNGGIGGGGDGLGGEGAVQ